MDPPPSGGSISFARKLALLALAGAAAAPLQAAEPADPNEIIITGFRQLMNVRPERSLNESDVAAYGLSNIGELFDEFDAEQGDGTEPLFLIDGKRAAGLGEVATFPIEVVSGIDVFPAGTAARLGATPGRRVYNIRLKPNALVSVTRGIVRGATGGHWSSRTAELSATSIQRPRRLHVAARVQDASDLLESDRNVRQPDGSPAELGRSRTLRPASGGVELRLSAADQLTDWLGGSVTAKIVNDTKRALLGLAPSQLPREQRSRNRAALVDLQLNGEAGDWLLSFAGSYQDELRKTRTDTGSAESLGTARSLVQAQARRAEGELTASRAVLNLPAGEMRLTASASYSRDSIRGRRDFNQVRLSDLYTQAISELSVGLDLPLISRAGGFLSPLGELSASTRFSRSRVTDLGNLSNSSYSLRWQPVSWINLSGSITTGRTPPAVGLLAEPLLETPGVRYFDPLRGESVDVLEISGGNPELGTQRGDSRRLSLHVKPLGWAPLELTGDYSVARNREFVTVLPLASDLLFLAFPERFSRDADGTLARIDSRPVSFARQTEEQFRYGFNLTLPVGSVQRAADPVADGDDEPGSGRLDRGSRRMQLTASHTWLLKSSLLIRPDLDPVDLLSPDAIALGGAGRPRHRLNFTLGYAERGLGIRTSGEYRSASHLALGGASSAGALRFSPLTTLNIRAFASGARISPGSAWVKGTRFSLSVLNLLNGRQRVRDAEGSTPLAFQPAYLDSVGRSMQFELRKSF